MSIRLNKYLANIGIGSRRSIESYLKENIVLVNEKRIFEPGFRLNPPKDKVLINGVSPEKPKLVYFMLNKPKGVVSTSSDELGRKNVVSFIKTKERIYPVGRLDQNTEGLIILTNDGSLANRLTHPKFELPKTYQALIRGQISPEKIKKLESGLKLNDGPTQPAKVKIIKTDPAKTLLETEIKEGRNKQIRRMLGALKIELVNLKRVKIGNLELGNLQSGEYKEIPEIDLIKLKS